MLQNRVLVPPKLRNSVLRHLHAAHAGVNAMLARAATCVYWPRLRQDIEKTRENCTSCHHHAPSQASQFSTPEPSLPQYPFQVICLDFFTWQNHTYLIIVDKYTNWLSILKLKKDDSKHVIEALRQYFSVFGVAETLCTDGAANFVSTDMEKFCKLWGIAHRISSAYYPTSNKRAEIGVKSAKRIIRENVGIQGSLNTNKFTQALLAHRNAPDPVSKVSPAQLVFGRQIKDHIPLASYSPQKYWVELAEKREDCFLKRHYLTGERLDAKARNLKPISPGDSVYVQDQNGPSPKRWSKSGIVVESLPYDSYLVKLDGSGRLSKRNRIFLRKYTPFSTVNEEIKPKEGVKTPLQEDAPSNVVVAYCALDTPLTLLNAFSTSQQLYTRPASPSEDSVGASRILV